MNEWSKKRNIMHRYNLTAHIYNMRYAEEQAAKIEAALEGLNIEQNDVILDAGCGTGILFDHVPDKAKTTVGLDISKNALLHAQERAKNLRNAHLILADADNMPLKREIFNYVFGITVIQNMPNPSETLSEIRRVAKANATIIVTGMKKAFNLEGFEKLLLASGLKIMSLKHEGLKCYVAICAKISS